MTTQHPSNLASNPVNSSAVRLIVSLSDKPKAPGSLLASLSESFDRIRDLFESFSIQGAHTSLDFPRIQVG